MHNLYF